MLFEKIEVSYSEKGFLIMTSICKCRDEDEVRRKIKMRCDVTKIKIKLNKMQIITEYQDDVDETKMR